MAILRTIGLLLCTSTSMAQQSAGAATATTFTAAQQTQFDAAVKEFQAGHWPAAVSALADLHKAVPDQLVVAKYLAEAEINAGQPAEAIAALSTVLAADKDDAQALAIEVHGYAQQGQAASRDEVLEHLQRLHDTGTTKLQSLVLESVALKDGRRVLFTYFLEPWSPYHIYLMAQIFNSTGQRQWRVTLESGDFDQPAFAKEHPDLASKGVRAYSMDGYSERAQSAQGSTQTHATYGFFDGRPPYDVFRAKALNIAEGRSGPLGQSTPTSPVPASK